MTPSAKQRGTTLIEILVVIVVFLVGILAIVQIFPGGFRLITLSRNNLAAAALSREAMDRLSATPEDMPAQIVPVRYQRSGGVLNVLDNPMRNPGDLTMLGDSVDQTGMVSASGVPIGLWPYVSGPNVMRRVVDDAYRIPAPDLAGAVGSLVVLRYGPLLTSSDAYASGLTYNPALEVYGANMEREDGDPLAGSPSLEFFTKGLDTSGAVVAFPQHANASTYRLTFAYYVKDTFGSVARKSFDGTVAVTAGSAFDTFSIAGPQLANVAAGDTLVSVEPESFTAARRFTSLASSSLFSSDPYEYVPLNPSLGVLLFNPAGFNAYEYRSTGRVPLTANVTYDVYDWRILHDDFRVPDDVPAMVRLSAPSLMSVADKAPDGLAFNGLNVPLPVDVAGSIQSEDRDFGLVDLSTGAVVLPTSYSVDYWHGSVTFLDLDGATPGTQADVAFPGAAASTRVTLSGHTLRALYEVKGQWSVQPLKAASQYLPTYDVPAIGQFYAGASSPIGGSSNRIYFPMADLGQRVTIGQIWYTSSLDGLVHSLSDANFVIRSSPTEALGLPFADITDADANSTGLEYASHGYAVRDVRGSSVSVRTMFDVYTFALSGDLRANFVALDRFRGSYHKAVTESFIQRGVEGS